MSQAATITSEETLAILKKAVEKYQKFLFIKEDNDRIVIEPLDAEDAKPYYELTADGERSMLRAVQEEAQGLGRPLDDLKI